MIRASSFRSEEQKNQVDRPVVDAVEIDRFFEARKKSVNSLEPRQPAVGNRQAVADPCCAEVLALEQNLDYYTLFLPAYVSGVFRQFLQRLFFAGDSKIGDDTLNRQQFGYFHKNFLSTLSGDIGCVAAIKLVCARVDPADVAIGTPVHDVQSAIAGIAKHHCGNIGEVHAHDSLGNSQIFNSGLVFGDDYRMVSIFADLVCFLSDRFVGRQDILLRASRFGAFARRVVIAQSPFMAPQTFSQMCGSDIECGIGVVCGFVRADINVDGAADVADAVFLLSELFVPGSPSTTCDDAADTNDDGQKDISDAVYLLGALFVPGSPPVGPPTTCGSDPSNDALGCASYPLCP